MSERNESLYDAEKFFELPEAGFTVPAMWFVQSRHQPTGFTDTDGSVWVPVTVDGEIKRKRL